MNPELQKEIENYSGDIDEFDQIYNKLSWWQKRNPLIKAWIIGCLYQFITSGNPCYRNRYNGDYVEHEILAQYYELSNTLYGEELRYLLIPETSYNMRKLEKTSNLEICDV